MEIRDAVEGDIEAIADIYRHYVRTNICTLEEHEPSTQSIRNEFSKTFISGAPFIVAVEPNTGRLCGYAYSGPFNDRSGYNSTCEDSIYVHPDYCRRRVGADLLGRLIAMIAKSGKTTQVIAKMSISPEHDVQDVPSCRLHMAFGFKLAGTLSRVGRKFDQWIDVVILQLSLDE